MIDSLATKKPTLTNGFKAAATNGTKDDNDDIYCTGENDEDDVGLRSKRLVNGKSKRAAVISSSSSAESSEQEEPNDYYTKKGKEQNKKRVVESVKEEETVVVKKPVQTVEPVVNRQPQMIRYETSDSEKKGKQLFRIHILCIILGFTEFSFEIRQQI